MDEPVLRSPRILSQICGSFLERLWRRYQREQSVGGYLPAALAARQDRTFHAWHELHRLVLMENLREKRARDLGDAADRLSEDAPRHAQPRAAWLLARRQFFLVPL